MATLRSGSSSPSPVGSLPPSFDVRNRGDTLREAVSRTTAEASQEVSRLLHSDAVTLSSSPANLRAAAPLPSPQEEARPTYRGLIAWPARLGNQPSTLSKLLPDLSTSYTIGLGGEHLTTSPNG